MSCTGSTRVTGIAAVIATVDSAAGPLPFGMCCGYQGQFGWLVPAYRCCQLVHYGPHGHHWLAVDNEPRHPPFFLSFPPCCEEGAQRLGLSLSSLKDVVKCQFLRKRGTLKS